MFGFVVGFVVVALCCELAEGHGRLLEPPSRSSMWRSMRGGIREFPNALVNYNDNQLFCGGRINYIYQHQQCGICGDPFQGPRNNEAGGRYAAGIIGRNYKAGQTIDIGVEITANHFGFFEFRLCPNNDVHKVATQECLDKHLLTLDNAAGTRYYLGGRRGTINLKAKLPEGLTCSQCVLQWRYKTGNSYGYAPNGTYCIGCGLQEMFYGCSDISISAGGNGPVQPQITSRPATSGPAHTQRPATSGPVHTQRPVVYTPRPTLPVPVHTNRPISGIFFGQPIGQTNGQNGQMGGQTGGHTITRCRAVNLWAGVPALDQWCLDNCQKGNCPAGACRCN
ncbi:uncharacterized protein LOC110461062 [Mizuhopecten yessoensis]|uniref:Chitin-binding type-4 domain-containing protein n=1 Tax=Mizuhopecten yessoensis TaxID=6573 RepID=A0A210Q117_MIZYE|nr:uncharacterized protein LOC110461062 [Mizuhopecten yessoensis]OWF42440.1 hypothetical protein KP79_PYT23283 [Mizuhopecten yessoensis]